MYVYYYSRVEFNLKPNAYIIEHDLQVKMNLSIFILCLLDTLDLSQVPGWSSQLVWHVGCGYEGGNSLS